MTTYSAWLAPSSPYPRIVCLMLFLTFSLSLLFGLMNRLACFFDANAPVEIKSYGNNPYVLGGFSVAVTVLIPNAFISLFVWNWAFEPLSTRTTEQPPINPSDDVMSHADDQSINGAIDQFSDVHSTHDSVTQSDHPSIRPHFDFSRLSGYRELIVDIYQTIKLQLNCLTSLKHTSHQTDELHDHFIETSIDLSTEAQSPDDYSLDHSPHSSDMSEDPSYAHVDDQMNRVDFSVCLSEYQSVAQSKQLNHNLSHSIIPFRNVNTDQSINGADLSETVTTSQTSVQANKQTIILSTLNRYIMLSFVPLIYLFTPSSIYALLMRNFVVDQFNNLVGYMPSNLIFGSPTDWNNPFRSRYNAWIVDLLPGLLGTDWMMGSMLLCKMSELGNEFLLLPLFYCQKWKHLSNNQSNNQAIRPRSMIWIALLPVIWLIVFGTISQTVSSTSACTLCDDMSGFTNFLENWVQPYVNDDRAFFALFGWITLCLIVDQLRHFRGTSIQSHKNCSCRLPYLLLLVLLLSQSAGMSFVFGTILRIFGEVQNTSVYTVSNTYLLVVFYTSMSWWQYLIRFVAFRALPSSSSALAVLFPVQLFEDVFSDLIFASFEPFSAQFFAFAAFQIVKTFVRDSDLVSMFILGVSHRVKHRHLPSESKPSFLAGYHSNSARALNRRVLRHQNFLIELCVKLVLIAVFLSDSLPFGDNPQWMATKFGQTLGAIEPGVWVYLRARVWLIGGLLFLMLIQCGVHVTILRFVTYLESVQTSVCTDDDNHTLDVSDSFGSESVSVEWNEEVNSVVGMSSATFQSQQLTDAHWTFHFLFFVVCVLRLIPLLLVVTSRSLENDGNSAPVSQCYNPILADWY